MYIHVLALALSPSLPPSLPRSLAADLVWSDPEEIAGWAVSPRGAGYLFGASVTQEVRTCLSLCVSVNTLATVSFWHRL